MSNEAPSTGGEPLGIAVEGVERGVSRRDLMQIGDLARESSRTVRTLHLYEQLGLLSPAARSKGRFRLYDRDALLRVRWIGKLKALGFSLGDIQTIVRQWQRASSAPGAMKRMREVYARKLQETREQIERLRALESEIESTLCYLDTCEVCDPQRVLSACDDCDLHDRELDVPELVSGFRAAGGGPFGAPFGAHSDAQQQAGAAVGSTAVRDRADRALIR